MEKHGPGEDEVSPETSPDQPQEIDEKSTSTPSKNDEKEQAVAKEANVRPERVSTFKDYLRVFTYATNFDFALMIAATFSSMGAGVVCALFRPKLPAYPKVRRL